MRKAIAPVVVLSLGAILMGGFSPPSHVDVSGHVYQADAGTPVAGAIVSNDWDSTTATTDAQGEFRMRVRRVSVDESIKFTARAGQNVGWHRRIGSLKPHPVEIVLGDPSERSRLSQAVR